MKGRRKSDEELHFAGAFSKAASFVNLMKRGQHSPPAPFTVAFSYVVSYWPVKPGKRVQVSHATPTRRRPIDRTLLCEGRNAGATPADGTIYAVIRQSHRLLAF